MFTMSHYNREQKTKQKKTKNKIIKQKQEQ